MIEPTLVETVRREWNKYGDKSITFERAWELNGGDAEAKRLEAQNIMFLPRHNTQYDHFARLTPEEKLKTVEIVKSEIEAQKAVVKREYARGKQSSALTRRLGLKPVGLNGGAFDHHKDALKILRMKQSLLVKLISQL